VLKKKSSHRLCFAQTLFNILTRSHLLSHLLAELKPTPNRTNLAAQSKYLYMALEAIKSKKQAKTKLR
jgi:hypothetical protein